MDSTKRWVTVFRKILIFAVGLIFATGPVLAEVDQEDYEETPFTRYGEFDQDEEENEAALFFQYGRFFGASLGVGAHGATGNRGQLWEGGFPHVAVRLHYWFDFNFALQMEFSTASHSFVDGSDSVDVSITRLGIDFKYYFDTRNASAAVTFANPYVLFGGGNYSKNEAQLGTETVDERDKFGFNFGAGLEFPISHKKSYLALEGKYHIVPYEDRASRVAGLEDLEGNFYSFAAHVLFTW